MPSVTAAASDQNIGDRNEERRSDRHAYPMDARPERRGLRGGLIEDISDFDSYTEESIFAHHDQRQANAKLEEEDPIDTPTQWIPGDITDLDSYTGESIFAHHNQRPTRARLTEDSEVESHEDIESQVKRALGRGGLRVTQ